MWPFKRKQRPALPVMVFKSGQAFFEYQCKYGHTEIRQDTGIVALVLDAKQMFGTAVPVKTDESGIQTATLRVASDDGGFITIAETKSGGGAPLVPGDVVVWLPGYYLPDVAAAAGDERSGWMGLIIAKIAREIDPSHEELKVICHY